MAGRKAIALAGAVCLLASLVAIVQFDAWTMHRLEHAVPQRATLIDLQRIVDAVTLKRVSAIVGPVLALVGWAAWRRGAWKDRYVMGWGGVITLSEYSVDILKPLMGRERPMHWLATNEPSSRWFIDHAVSFPSGHTAYFWALVLPVVIRWPRIGIPLLVLPVCVTAQRLLVLAHHPGDVLASIGIVLLATAAVMPWICVRLS